MVKSFVCSVYVLAVCVVHPIQANDECLINDGLMDEIPSLNNQTTINAGSPPLSIFPNLFFVLPSSFISFPIF